MLTGHSSNKASTAAAPKTESKQSKKIDSHKGTAGFVCVCRKFIILFPPNIYRNMEEALEVFAYISKTDHFSTMERLGVHWGGAVLMWAVARFKLRKK